jgi:predicted MFS family arabinose efflux permease
VIILSIIASGLACLTLSFSASFASLYLAYLLGGVSSGLFEPIGNSLVAMLSSGSTRGKAIGNFAAFGDIGRIAVLSGTTSLAGRFGVSAACLMLFGSTLGALLLAVIAVPGRASGGEVQEEPIHLGHLLKNRKFCFATAAGITDSFSSASLYIFIPLLLHAKGIALANVLYFDVVFFAGYMTGRLILGRLADRHGAPNILMGCDGVMAGLVLLLTLVSGKTVIVTLLFLLGIFTRGSSPVIRSMVADSMDEKVSFHDAFSAYSFASRGASALSRPIYGFLAAAAGISFVFYVSSAMSLVTLYPAARYKSR